jgi:hypothetical protein
VTDATATPTTIRRYLEAHDRRDTQAALDAFTQDATVIDDGREYHGAEQIRRWLGEASTEFSYTRTLLETASVDPTTWAVHNRLEGDFPGGTVDLWYRFVLDGDRISKLVIAP